MHEQPQYGRGRSPRIAPLRWAASRVGVAAAGLLLVASGAQAQRRPAAPKPAPAAKPTGPTFALRVTSADEDPARRTVYLVYADGDGDVTWASDKSQRSIVRVPVTEARALAARLGDFARAAITAHCGAQDPAKAPAPLVFRQARSGMPRTLAVGCRVTGLEKELSFLVADSVADGARGPELVGAWSFACPVFATFADSVAAALRDPGESAEDAPVAGTCPKVYTDADIEQFARRLMVGGETSDSAVAVLAAIGPRVLRAVTDQALADIDPGARARASRVAAAVVQQPFAPSLDPDEFVEPLTKRWRDEPDRAVADTIGLALASLVERNPGRIRSVDTLHRVLRDALPALAQRGKGATAADVDRDAPALQPIARALQLVAALRELAGPVVSTVSGLVGTYGSGVDVLVARAVGSLGNLANAAGPGMRQLVLEPLPQRKGARTVGTFEEAQAVAVAAARALASTGAAGRRDIDELWALHVAPIPPDTAGLPTTVPRPPVAVAVPTDSAARDSTPAADATIAVAPDTAGLGALRARARAEREWGTPDARSVLLEREIRRQALVAGFGAGCAADSAMTGPLALVATEPLRFEVEPPTDDETAQMVKARLLVERELSRVQALDALGECGPRAMAQLTVIARLANATSDDADVPEPVRRAAIRAIPRVRRLQ